MVEQLVKHVPYEFKRSDAFDFANFLRAETKERSGQLVFKVCPYCKSASKGNQEKFAISLETGQFKCMRASCGAKGNMLTLSRDFGFSLGNAVDEYFQPRKKYRQFPKPKQKIIPKSPAVKYLESRGISQRVAEEYEITVQNGKENILVFPFYDENGFMQFVKYRKIDFDREKDKNKEWCEKNCKPILFGMKQCNPENKTLVLTEGQLDSLSVAEAGIENAVSVPNGAQGFTWVPYCWDFLSKHSELIVFGDFEKGSITLLEEMKKRFHGQVRHVREEDYKDCKDANDILRKYGAEAVKHAVENAVAVPVERVIPLADVESVNIYKLPKLKTGISELDKTLYGGIPFGMVCLISGKRGEGKSTFASQIMANAIDQSYPVFVYSGEMPNYLFKSWFDFQIAGRNHIVENNDGFGMINRFITNPNQALIDDWYRDKAYIYDSRIVESDEKEDLLGAIIKAIMQYGIKVILIDNLMTAMYIDEKNGTDKYEQQGMFVRKLTEIAIKYDCLILLVAHKRKNNFSTDANDEVSGSGDITNLAGITLGYDRYGRDENVDDDQRRLTVLKNRLFGKVNLSGICLNYDEKSKRIYGAGDDLNRRFSWNDSDEFAEIDGFGDDIPF